MRKNLKQGVVTSGDIKQGMAIMADLISSYGDAYWPFFEHLEKELAKRKTRSERLADFRERQGYQ